MDLNLFEFLIKSPTNQHCRDVLSLPWEGERAVAWGKAALVEELNY